MLADIDTHTIVAKSIVFRVPGLQAYVAHQVNTGRVVVHEEAIGFFQLRVLPAPNQEVLLLLCGQRKNMLRSQNRLKRWRI